MFKKNKIKSLCMAVLASLSMFVSMPLTAKAASANVIAGGYTGYSVNVMNADGVHSEWNANYQKILIDGEDGFCIDPGYVLSPGGDFNISSYEKHELSIIAYEGWVVSNHTNEDYLATQFMIWEALGGSITSTSFSSYGSYKAAIQNRINHHWDKPSFDQTSITVKVGESITLTDTNGVFKDYWFSSSDGLKVDHNGNSLTITGTLDAPDNAIVSYDKIPSKCVGTSIAVRKAGSQSAAKFYVDDPLNTKINVKVLKFGSVKIAKQDELGNYVPNTSFKLSYNADMSDPIGTYTTGADGTVKIDELLPQTVYIQETAVPANLILDSTVRSVTIIPNEVVSYTQNNNIQKGKITLVKHDKETGTKPQGDAKLDGAVYGLYARENIVDSISGKVLVAKGTKLTERVTKADGSMEDINNLNLGKYYVQELSSPEGYILNTDKINIDLTYEQPTQKVVVRNVIGNDTVINGDFQITKVVKKDQNSEINKTEKGAEFTAVLKTYVNQYGSVEEAIKHKEDFSNREYDILTTNDDGIAVSKRLAYGTYVVKQTKAGNENYNILKDTFEVKIKDQNQQTMKYVISNQLFQSYLQIVKKDAESGKNIGLSAATFKVFDVDNNTYVSQRVGLQRLDTWKTDKNGKVTLPLQLSAGNYQLEEVKAPNGYLINKHPIKFKMTSSNISMTDTEGQPITVIEMKDEKPYGNIELVKSDKDTNKKLQGVEYQLTAYKDIIDSADGSIIYKKGDRISIGNSVDGKYDTDNDGNIRISKLPLGSYVLKETKALDGYVKDDKEHIFTIEQKDDIQQEYTHSKQFTNQKTKMSMMKVDVHGKPLEGARMQIISMKSKEIVDEWVSDGKEHRIDALLVGKEYMLREVKAPKGYVRAKDVSFIVKNTEDIQKVDMINTEIEVSKKSVTGDDELEGAQLSVLNKEGNVVDTWISSKKAHKVSNLVEGEKYTLHEDLAPLGYVSASDIEFIAKTNKKDELIQMVDNVYYAEKKDVEGHFLKGAKMQVVSTKTKNIVDEWISDGEKHAIANLKEQEEYILREVKAPFGYKTAEDMTFMVSKHKEAQTIEMIDKYILTKLHVHKIDSVTKNAITSKDFIFTAYKDKDCKDAIISVNGDKKTGTASFELRYGEYWIKETKSPDGYLLSDEAVHVVINQEGVFVNDKMLNHEDDGYSFVFENKMRTPIKTGDHIKANVYVFLMVSSFIMAAGIVLMKIKRLRSYKK